MGNISWSPGKLKLIALLLTLIVGLFGLLLTIFGIVAYIDLSDGSHCTKDTDCTNWAVVGIIVMGAFFFLLAVLNAAGVLLGGFIGKHIVRIVTVRPP